MRKAAVVILAAASLGVTFANGGHSGLTVFAVVLAVIALVLAWAQLVADRDDARALYASQLFKTETQKALTREHELAAKDARYFAADQAALREAAEHSARYVAGRHASRIRPKTAWSEAEHYADSRIHGSAQLAAVYLGRAAKDTEENNG